MSIIDRSPGGFIIITNAVLYTTVLVEVGMLMSGSVALMGLFMALILLLSAGLCAFIMNLMGSEAYIVGESVASETATTVPEVRPASAPTSPNTTGLTATPQGA
jgi:hypothetical protein